MTARSRPTGLAHPWATQSSAPSTATPIRRTPRTLRPPPRPPCPRPTRQAALPLPPRHPFTRRGQAIRTSRGGDMVRLFAWFAAPTPPTRRHLHHHPACRSLPAPLRPHYNSRMHGNVSQRGNLCLRAVAYNAVDGTAGPALGGAQAAPPTAAAAGPAQHGAQPISVFNPAAAAAAAAAAAVAAATATAATATADAAPALAPSQVPVSQESAPASAT